MKKEKFYVVWAGVTPGIYTSWTECQLQTKGYEGAKFKSFDTREEAEQAFAASPYEYIKRNTSAGSTPSKPSQNADAPYPAAVLENSLAVDAACSGNPGAMEYRGVHVASRQQVFHYGPVYGTNNIGEFRAWPCPAEAKRLRHAYLQRQRQCHRLGQTEEMQDQATPRLQNRTTFPADRTRREMAA